MEQELRVFAADFKRNAVELARLRKENADLRETNEILKKATAIFSASRSFKSGIKVDMAVHVCGTNCGKIKS